MCFTNDQTGGSVIVLSRLLFCEFPMVATGWRAGGGVLSLYFQVVQGSRKDRDRMMASLGLRGRDVW